MFYFIIAVLLILIVGFFVLLVQGKHSSLLLRHAMSEKFAEYREHQQQQYHELISRVTDIFHQQQQVVHKNHLEGLTLLQETVKKGLYEAQTQLTEILHQNTRLLTERVTHFTQMTEQRLKDISKEVDKRLNDGFEKTTQTFTDIVKRLALIDQAQQKITELSTNVISLQQLLADKRSRGAFGEVQLANLIRNVLPEEHFALQFTLKNDKRCDCILFLPEPSGHIVIDAKFPLENYQRFMDQSVAAGDIEKYRKLFRQDVRVHIDNIREKYIIPGYTTDGAIMFIPAEAVFAEIHAHFPDLVEYSHQSKVWLVSPTTMMAILTTARAVLKDDATKKQIHVIREHLQFLARDFSRFQERMDNLQKHIEQASNDVRDVNISAKKITGRFVKIDQVELTQLTST